MGETDVLLALGIGATFKVFVLNWLANRKRKEYVGTISRIYVYPLKSARELQDVSDVTLTRHGLSAQGLCDRHWVISRNGQRQNLNMLSHMTLIRTRRDGDYLRLDAPGMEPLRLPIHPQICEENVVTILVSQAPQTVFDCGDKAAAWICKVLGKVDLRLNHSAPTLAKRLSCTTIKDWPTQIQPHDEVAFQDFVQCMFVGDSSLQVLNKRLVKPVSPLQFRPNLVIEGSKPYDEANWQTIYIGKNAEIRFVDNCTRCAIVTINPETGTRDNENQPLKEMKKFRCMEPYGPLKPVMGVHAAVESEGEIKLGDPVYVIRK